jgi:hypothetical protein
VIFLDKDDGFTTVHYRPEKHIQVEKLRSKEKQYDVRELNETEYQIFKAAFGVCDYCKELADEAGFAL